MEGMTMVDQRIINMSGKTDREVNKDIAVVLAERIENLVPRLVDVLHSGTDNEIIAQQTMMSKLQDSLERQIIRTTSNMAAEAECPHKHIDNQHIELLLDT